MMKTQEAEAFREAEALRKLKELDEKGFQIKHFAPLYPVTPQVFETYCKSWHCFLGYYNGEVECDAEKCDKRAITLKYSC